MDIIENLTPAEIAVLRLANDIENDHGDKPTILASNATLILMVVLAEGFTRLQNDSAAEKALTEIKEYSNNLVSHLESRGSYIRYDQPVRNLLEKLDAIGFPILPASTEVDALESGEKKRSNSSISYEFASETYKSAISSLESQKLLIDPPWYKSPLAIGSLIVLLGSVPLEINIKTVKGQEVITSIEAKFWDYTNTSNSNSENTRLNIKLVKFLDKAVENLGTGFVNAWKDQNKTRVNELMNETEKVTHNKSLERD